MAFDNISLVRRFTEEVWNKGNMAVCDELLSPKIRDARSVLRSDRRDRSSQASDHGVQDGVPRLPRQHRGRRRARRQSLHSLDRDRNVHGLALGHDRDEPQRHQLGHHVQPVRGRQIRRGAVRLGRLRHARADGPAAAAPEAPDEHAATASRSRAALIGSRVVRAVYVVSDCTARPARTRDGPRGLRA